MQGGGRIWDGGRMQAVAEGMQTSPYCDFSGFDIYGYSDLTDAGRFLRSYPTTKPVWVPEFWPDATGAYSSTDPEDFLSFWGLAGPRLSFWNPFFTDDFASYDLAAATDPATIIALYQEGTGAYSSYAQVAALPR